MSEFIKMCESCGKGRIEYMESLLMKPCEHCGFDPKASGMSQERTEQRDWAKDREIIGAATPGPWRRQKCLVAGRGAFAGQVIADCGGGFKPIDESNAIYITESRTAWPAALDEIDRLNAVIKSQAAVNAQWIDRLKDASAIVTQRDKQISDLTAKVQERDAEREKYLMQNGELKAKVKNRDEHIKIHIKHRDEIVQERDERIEYMDSKIKELTQAWDAEKESVYFRSSIIRERDKEITRLRAALVVERDKADEFLNYMAVDRIDAALKGVE